MKKTEYILCRSILNITINSELHIMATSRVICRALTQLSSGKSIKVDTITSMKESPYNNNNNNNNFEKMIK